MSPFVVMLLGWPLGGAWVGALMMCEAATWFSTGPFVPGAPRGQASRWIYLATGVALNLTWVWLSLAFWFNPAEGSAFTALLIWACLLIGGISFAYRSPFTLFVAAAPVSLAMIAAPLLAPRFEGAQQMISVAGALACVAYAWELGRRNLAQSRDLRRASLDLIEQKHAAEAANRAKSAFLAMMSHEIRTPMNGVLGMAHALRETTLEPKQRQYLETLIQSGDSLTAILDDVLDLARIEVGRLEIASEPFDVREVVLRAQGVWRQAAADKGLLVLCEIEADAPDWIHGDAVRVRQVLFNLLSNAIKFTDAGEVRVALKRGDGEVVIAVSDTGPGIGPEVRARLFQRFSQAEAGDQRRYGGAGLGLAISQELAVLMGGQIEVVSHPGAGAAFSLRLPMSPASPFLADPPKELAQPGPLDVLVVDDNATNRAVATVLLEAMGARAHVAVDGAEALEVLRGRPVDVILMDIHMPVMDGVETTARIRAGEAGDSATPIVALTADAMAGARERLLAQGFDDYLTKPINPALLAETLSRVEPRT